LDPLRVYLASGPQELDGWAPRLGWGEWGGGLGSAGWTAGEDAPRIPGSGARPKCNSQGKQGLYARWETKHPGVHLGQGGHKVKVRV
jgi:hypothetical protein